MQLSVLTKKRRRPVYRFRARRVGRDQPEPFRHPTYLVRRAFEASIVPITGSRMPCQLSRNVVKVSDKNLAAGLNRGAGRASDRRADQWPADRISDVSTNVSSVTSNSSNFAHYSAIRRADGRSSGGIGRYPAGCGVGRELMAHAARRRWFAGRNPGYKCIAKGS